MVAVRDPDTRHWQRRRWGGSSEDIQAWGRGPLKMCGGAQLRCRRGLARLFFRLRGSSSSPLRASLFRSGRSGRMFAAAGMPGFPWDEEDHGHQDRDHCAYHQEISHCQNCVAAEIKTLRPGAG